MAGVTIGVTLISAPFLAIVIRSLLVWSGDYPHPSFGNYAALLTDPRFFMALANSLIAGLSTTLLSLALGFSLAFLVARTDMPGRRLLGLANFTPFFLSPYVGAIAWIFLLAPHGGLISTWAFENHGISLEALNIYSLPGAIFVLTLFYTPYVYLFLLPSLREMDAALEDTARIHGATLRATMRYVTVPMLLPALSSAALIVFITSTGLFDVPMALGVSRGIRFVPTEIFAMAHDPADFGRAAAFGVVFVALTAGLILWQQRSVARRDYRIGAGEACGPCLIHLRWPARIAALGLEALYIALGLLLPLLALLAVALTRQWGGRFAWSAATTVNFAAVLTDHDQTRLAIDNSLILAVLGSTIAVGLAGLLSYYLTRGPSRHRARVENLLAVATGVPGAAVGLGYLIVTVHTPLVGALGVILVACVARFLPFATRNVTVRAGAIDPELDHIARVSGADWQRTMRHIVVPLFRPSLIASWLMLFVMMFRELGTTFLLYASGSETLSVLMVNSIDRQPGYVAALALLQMLVLLLAFALFALFAHWGRDWGRASLSQRLA